MSELKVPTTIKVMYVGAILLGITGMWFDDNVSIVISVITLVILSCAISILEGLHNGFEKLIKLEIANTKLENKGE